MPDKYYVDEKGNVRYVPEEKIDKYLAKYPESREASRKELADIEDKSKNKGPQITRGRMFAPINTDVKLHFNIDGSLQNHADNTATQIFSGNSPFAKPSKDGVISDVSMKVKHDRGQESIFDSAQSVYKQEQDWIRDVQNDPSISEAVKQSLMNDYKKNIRISDNTVEDKDMPFFAKKWLKDNEVSVPTSVYVPGSPMFGGGQYIDGNKQANTPEQIAHIKDFIANTPQGRDFVEKQKNYVEYLENSISDVEVRVPELREKCWQEQYELSKTHPYAKGKFKNKAEMDNARIDYIEKANRLSQKISVLNLAEKNVEEQKKLLAAVKDGDLNVVAQFGKQIGRDFWDMAGDIGTLGLSPMMQSLYDNSAIKGVQERNDKDELTEEDRLAMSAMANNQAYQELMGERRTIAQDVASGIMQSVPYMVNFATTGGIGKSVTSGTTGLLKQGIKRNAISAIKQGAKVWTEKIGARLAGFGVNIADAIGRSSVMSAISPHTYRDMFDNMSGKVTYGYDIEGKPYYLGNEEQMNVADALLNAWGANTIENVSEFSGIGLEKGQVALSGLLKQHVPELAKVLSLGSTRNQFFQGVNQAMEKAGFNGTVNEFLEEQISTILHSFFEDGQAKWSDLVDPKQQFITYLTVAAIGSGTAVMNTGGNQLMKYGAKKAYANAFKDFERAYSSRYNDEALQFANNVKNGTIEEKQNALAEVVNSDRSSDQQKLAALNLYRAVLTYEAYEGAKAAQVEEATTEVPNLIEENANPDMGAVVSATIAGLETPVQIKGGNIVQNDDGTINREQSDKEIYYTDATGKRQVTSIDFVSTVEEKIPIDEAISDVAKRISDPIISEQENNEARLYDQGDTVRFSIDGNTNLVGQIAGMDEATGNYIINAETLNGIMQVQVQPRQIFNDDNLEGVYNGTPVVYINENGEQVQGVVSLNPDLYAQGLIGFENGDVVPVDNVIGSVGNNEPPILSENVLSDDNLKANILKNEGISSFEQSNLKTNDPRVFEIEKGLSAVENTDGSYTLDKQFAKSELKKADSLMKKLNEDYSDNGLVFETVQLPRKDESNPFEKPLWGIIARMQPMKADTPQMPVSNDVSVQLEQIQENNTIKHDARTKKPTLFQKRLNAIEDNVNTIRDRVLFGIASGAYKFRWKDQGVSKGLASELGLSFTQRERKSRIGLLSNNGYTPSTLAHHLWEEADGRINDTDIRDEIIDVLYSVYSRKQALELLEQNVGIPEENYYKQQEDAFAYEDELRAQEEALISEAMMQINEEDLLFLRDRLISLDATENQLNEIFTYSDYIDLIEQLEDGQKSDTEPDNEQAETDNSERNETEPVERTVDERDRSAEDTGDQRQNTDSTGDRITLSADEQRIADNANAQIDAEIADVQKELTSLQTELATTKKRLAKAQSDTQGNLFDEGERPSSLFNVPADLSKENTVDNILSPIIQQLDAVQTKLDNLAKGRDARIREALDNYRKQGKIFEKEEANIDLVNEKGYNPAHFKVGDIVINKYNGVIYNVIEPDKKGMAVLEDVNTKINHKYNAHNNAHFILYDQTIEDKKEQADNDVDTPAYGASNTLISTDQYEELRKRMRDKLNNLNSGFDPELFTIGIGMAMYNIEAGTRKFADFSSRMIADFGDKIKPYLKSFYEGARHAPGMDELSKDMDSFNTVNTFDLDNLNIKDITLTGSGSVKDNKQTEINFRDIVDEDKKHATLDSDPKEINNEIIEDIPDTIRQDSLKRNVGTLSDRNISDDENRHAQRHTIESSQKSIRDREQSNEAGFESGRGRGSRDKQNSITLRNERDRISGSDGADNRATGRTGEISGNSIILNQNNYRIKNADSIVPNGEIAKIKSNIDAIKLLKKIESENREATQTEKEKLSKYSGWGGLSEVLNRNKFHNNNWTAKYGKYHKEIVSLLDDEEYNAAINSTINAHYTDGEVVASLWDLARRLGFKGGNILEPAVGTGNFFGLMPEDIAKRSLLRAYELDNITGRIASKLYPDALVKVTGYENSKDRNIDLIITNVPFGQIAPYDNQNKDISNFSLHNYFIAKGIKQLSPNGIGIFVTSTSSMDAHASSKFRQWVTNEGNTDFIGAIRLPNNTFSRNAGTSVTTDILVFKKRDSEHKSQYAQDFRYTIPVADVQLKDGTPSQIEVNEYFAKNPEMMLGTLHLAHEVGSGGLYSGNDVTLVAPKGQDTIQEIKKAVKLLPENISEISQDSLVQQAEIEDKEGTIVERDGVVYEVENGNLILPDWVNQTINNTQKKKVPKDIVAKEYLQIKDTAKALLNAERVDAENIEQLRYNLNTLYDKFIKQYGYLNNNLKLRFLMDVDIDYNIVFALEKINKSNTIDDKGNVKQQIEINKSDILSKRVIYPTQEPKSASNLSDAINISIAYKGRLNLPYISELLNMSIDDVRDSILKDGLGFVNPSNELLEDRDTYLSGYVRTKYREAKLAAENNPEFEVNVKALKEVVPDDIPASQIKIRLGSPFIGSKFISDFVRDKFKIEAKIDYSHTLKRWIVQIESGSYSIENRTKYASGNFTAIDLFEKGLNLKQPEVYDYFIEDGKRRSVKNAEKTAAAQAAMNLIADEFVNFVYDNNEAMTDIERRYNDKYNDYIEKKYSVPNIKHYPNASSNIELRMHQKRAVSRGLKDSLLLAHQVGTGKTFTMQTIAMEQRRLGLAKKPMIVVQNATLEQFAISFKQLYPSVNLLAPTKKMMDARNRQRLFSLIAYGDYDCIIIPQSFVDKIPDNPVRQKAYLNEQLKELEFVLSDIDPQENRSLYAELQNDINNINSQIEKLDAPKVKDIAKKQLGLTKRISNQADRKTDNVLYFEEMGIDSLLVDEAHAYKRLGFFTKMSNIKGIDTSRSQRAFGMYMKTQYIHERTGGKNVIFATGTPITNTMAEVWTMMKYISPDILESYNISSFDEFASTFGSVEPSLEFTPTGNFKIVERFKSYINAPELLTAFRAKSDVVLTEDIPEFKKDNTIPKLRDNDFTKIIIPQSQALIKIMDDLKDELKEWEKLPPMIKREKRHIPLLVFNKAKQAAIDLRLIDPTAIDDSESKTNRVISEVKRIYNESRHYKGTQLIFCDMYQSSSKFSDNRFNLYEDIKAKLVKLGIDQTQIAIINDYEGNKRCLLFDAVNDGDISILIGGTEKMGVGVNVQQRLVAIHHVDAPPRPMDFEQRNGRILRQGNLHADMGIPVEVITYGVEKTLDATAYQRLAIKQKFINQMMKGETLGREVEDNADEDTPTDMTFDQMMSTLSGSQYAILHVQKTYELKKLETAEKNHLRRQIEINNQYKDVTNFITSASKKLESLINAKNIVEKCFPANKVENIQVGDRLYNEKLGSEIQRELDIYIKEFPKTLSSYGKVAPLEIRLNQTIPVEFELKDLIDNSFYYGFKLGDSVFSSKISSGTGAIASINSKIINIQDDIDALNRSIDASNKKLPVLKEELKKPFARSEQLTKLRAEIADIEEKMQMETDQLDVKNQVTNGLKLIGSKKFDELINLLKKNGLSANIITDPVIFIDKLKEVASSRSSQDMRTNVGDVYGFVTPDGTVYLDSTRMNANTPIHEFGHLWNDFIKNNNPELYQKGADLIKQSPYFWERIYNNPAYSDLSEDGKTDEALAMAIGDKGEGFVNRNMRQRFSDWLADVWKAIKKVFGINSNVAVDDMTLSDFTDTALNQLLGGKDIVDKYLKSTHNVDDDIRYAIGDTKEIGRSGRKIDFIRANQTNTYKAVKRFFDKNKIKYSDHVANTGSRYIKASLDTFSADIRFANHTKSYYSPEDVNAGIEYNLFHGKIYSVKIDLSLNQMGVADIIALLDTISSFNKSDMPNKIVNDYTETNKLQKLRKEDIDSLSEIASVLPDFVTSVEEKINMKYNNDLFSRSCDIDERLMNLEYDLKKSIINDLVTDNILHHIPERNIYNFTGENGYILEDATNNMRVGDKTKPTRASVIREFISLYNKYSEKYSDLKNEISETKSELSKIREKIRFHSVSGLASATGSEMTEDLKKELNDELRGTAHKLAEAWFDRWLPVKKMLKTLEKSGLKIEDHNNWYLRADAVTSSIQSQYEGIFYNSYMLPFLKSISAIEDKGYTLRDIENYAMLKGGSERNELKKTEAINKYKTEYPDADKELIEAFEQQLPSDYSGVTAIEEEIGISADKYIADFEKNLGDDCISDFWKKKNAATNYTLKRIYESGGISKSEYDKLLKVKYYVPLRGHDEQTAEDLYDYSPNMGVYFSSPMIKANGRKSRAENPFAYIDQMGLSAIKFANWNSLNQSLYRLAAKDKTKILSCDKAWYVQTGFNEDNTPVWESQEPAYSDNPEQYRKNQDDFEKRMLKLQQEGLALQQRGRFDLDGLFIKPAQREQHRVPVWLNGNEYSIYINANPAIAQSINGANLKQRVNDEQYKEGLLRAAYLLNEGLGKTQRWMANNITSKSPEFLIRNLMRDVIQSATILPVKEGVKYEKDFLANLPKSATALSRYLSGKSNISNPTDAALVNFFLNGGATGYVHFLELQKNQKKINKEISDLKKNNFVKTYGFLKYIPDSIEAANKWAENLSRFAVYLTSLQQGRSITRSISDAKEVTVNFNRTGSGKMGNSFLRNNYMFVNPALQALYNMSGVAYKNGKKLTALTVAFSSLGFIAPMIALMVGGEDGWEEYWNLSQWDRQNNFCVYSGKGFIKIALPQELRIFTRIGDNIFSAILNKKDKLEASIDSVLGFADLSPINPLGVSTDDLKNLSEGGIIAKVAPDRYAPFVELAVNKNFADNRIYNQYANKYSPGHKQALTNKKGKYKSPDWLVDFSKALNDLTGGDDVSSGVISLNPDKLNHLLRAYLGGIYTTAAQAADVTNHALDPNKKVEIKDTPLRALYISTDDIHSHDAAKYFDIQREVDKKMYEIKGYQKEAQQGKIGIYDFSQKLNSLNYAKLLQLDKLIKEIKKYESTLNELDVQKQKEAEQKIDVWKKQVVEIYNTDK